MSRPQLAIGTEVRFDDRKWVVAGIEGNSATGPRVWLAEQGSSDSLVAFSLDELMRGPFFELLGGPALLRVPQVGLLSTVSEEERFRALSVERHVREVETGYPAPGCSGEVRAEYDPASTTLAEREQAKAEELTGQGWPAVSRATVRRWRRRYRDGGVWGLVPKQRGSTTLDGADPKVIAALRVLLAAEAPRSRSRGWKTRMRRETAWKLEADHGAGVVEVPPRATFNKLLDRVEAEMGLGGTVRQRRGRAARPAPPFKPTVVLRPGELVMLDSSPLDVLVAFDDGVVGRLEITKALDVATRSVWAVLRPAGSKLTDVAVLLAQMMTPMVMRPGWPESLAMAASVVPYQRLVSVDERLKDAAARPVVVPETIVVDQGKVFVSPATRAACESLGISLQPVPPANGPAKGNVERSFGSFNSLFCQYLPGYTGSNISERGSKVAQERLWSVAELRELLDEFLVLWHHRPHAGLRHPLMPARALTPNEAWASLLPVVGYVPVPLKSDDFVELLPVRWQAITDAGIRFDYRTYDHACLHTESARIHEGPSGEGLWEVHYNPYDPLRIWVRLADGFVEVPWIHATSISLPFTHHIWEHICKVTERTESRAEHEEQLVLALDDLLRRASRKKKLTRTEKRAVAKSRASGADLVPVPASATNVLDTPTLSFGLAGVYEMPEPDDETVPDEDDSLLVVAEQESAEAADGSSILDDTDQEDDLWLP
ncbi:transposase [Streptomyces hydrogenans]|uniref:transposase n=1 Tax=Streptomyces hydrogenans TaxID=1873719 RepID=UPI0035D74BD9